MQKFDLLPPCPGCGQTSFVVVKRMAYGWCETIYDELGKLLETSTDNLSYGRSGLVRCGNCGEVRRDLRVIESEVVVVA